MKFDIHQFVTDQVVKSLRDLHIRQYLLSYIDDC